MKRAGLSNLFDPGSVAVIGASTNAASIGNRVLTLLRQHEFPGALYGVNPRYSDIDGVACVPSIVAIETPVDLAIVAVRQDLVVDVVVQCARAGVGACIIMSAGFGEGGAGAQQVAQLRELVRESPMRICGPNSLGVFAPVRRLAATFSTAADRRRDLRRLKLGTTAVLSQSGALGYSAMVSLAWAGVGIGVVASPGNSLDIDVAECIEYWLAQPDVGFVAALVEEISGAARMRQLGDAVVASRKPVAVLKLGRSELGQRASLSHTGAMSGSADVYSGFFRQYGIIEVADVPGLIALGKLFERQTVRYGRRVAVLTPSGGAGILIADHLSRCGLEQPGPSPELAQRLRRVLPPFSSVLNPIDVTAQATANAEESGSAHAQEVALSHVVESGEYDVVIAHVPASAKTAHRLETIARISNGTLVPIVLFSDRPANDEAIAALGATGLPWFTEVDQMATGLAAAVRWTDTDSGPSAPRESAAPARPSDAGPSDPELFERVRSSLARMGSGTVAERRVTDPQAAVEAAHEIGYPVVVKIDPSAVVHKTELDGIRVGLDDDQQVRDAAIAIRHSAAAAGHCDIDLVVQQMVTGVEVLLSFRRDPKFGPVVTLGCGGVHTELLKQFAVRLAPLRATEVEGMITEVQPLDRQLKGLRGRAPANRQALINFVVQLSELAVEKWTDVNEVEINPLIVSPSTVAAVDLVVS